MEAYLNILHFCFYKAHYRLHLLANKVNPFRLLYRLPFVKRRCEKLGVNIYEAVDQAFGDPRAGLSVTVAGGALSGVMGTFLFALLFVFDQDIDSVYVFVAFFVAFAIAYFFVFKDDKYLAYFEQYENWSKAESMTYGCVTLASVVATFLLFYIWG
jgi:hypothetical protein